MHWLLTASGWTITERTTRDELPIPVPIQPRHICILFRRFVHFGQDVTRGYVEALEARGVPHLLVGGKSFHDREEVETMRAALAAMEWPDDDVSVFATLRGALFAIDDEIAASCIAIATSRFTRSVSRRTRSLPPSSRRWRLLRRLHSRRNYRPVADTITELLTATRAHVGFVLRNAGEQALANVLHVAELARQYEANGGISFRGFVETLNEQADGGQAAEAPILEEGTDGVRLMTTHKAKGLEFPVVVLADMTAKLQVGPRRPAGRSSRRMPATCGWADGRRSSWRRRSRPRSPGTKRKASAWLTSPRRARGICWSYPRSATRSGTAAGCRR